MFGSLEKEESRGKGGGEERGGREMVTPYPCSDVLNIKWGNGNRYPYPLFGCFKN